MAVGALPEQPLPCPAAHRHTGAAGSAVLACCIGQRCLRVPPPATAAFGGREPFSVCLHQPGAMRSRGPQRWQSAERGVSAAFGYLGCTQTRQGSPALWWLRLMNPDGMLSVEGPEEQVALGAGGAAKG